MIVQEEFLDPQNSIKVWDIFIRSFHWILVLSFFIAYITEDHFISLHTFAGYTILALLFLRIIWGLIGTKYARFSNFTYSLSNVKLFIKETFSFKAKRYIGHNPAGGAMIILLIVSLVMCTLTGMAVYGAEDQAGPMASLFRQESLLLSNHVWAELLEETHEFFANFILFLVVIHIAGVLIESFIHQENLVKSMITGRKIKEITHEI
jgi:cytochrome b